MGVSSWHPGVDLGSTGTRWDLLGSAGYLLGSTGTRWDPLGPAGTRWDLLGPAGICWDTLQKQTRARGGALELHSKSLSWGFCRPHSPLVRPPHSTSAFVQSKNSQRCVPMATSSVPSIRTIKCASNRTWVKGDCAEPPNECEDVEPEKRLNLPRPYLPSSYFIPGNLLFHEAAVR